MHEKTADKATEGETKNIPHTHPGETPEQRVEREKKEQSDK